MRFLKGTRILKGGYAIVLWTEKARTTQDVDLLTFEISL